MRPAGNSTALTRKSAAAANPAAAMARPRIRTRRSLLRTASTNCQPPTVAASSAGVSDITLKPRYAPSGESSSAAAAPAAIRSSSTSAPISRQVAAATPIVISANSERVRRMPVASLPSAASSPRSMTTKATFPEKKPFGKIPSESAGSSESRVATECRLTENR